MSPRLFCDLRSLSYLARSDDQRPSDQLTQGCIAASTPKKDLWRTSDAAVPSEVLRLRNPRLLFPCPVIRKGGTWVGHTQELQEMTACLSHNLASLLTLLSLFLSLASVGRCHDGFE
jgi:hypothetical protein